MCITTTVRYKGCIIVRLFCFSQTTLALFLVPMTIIGIILSSVRQSLIVDISVKINNCYFFTNIFYLEIIKNNLNVIFIKII